MTDRVFIPCRPRLHLHTSVSAHLDHPGLHTLAPASSHFHTSVSAHLDRPRLHTLLARVFTSAHQRLRTPCHTSVSSHLACPRLHTLSTASSHLQTSISAHLDQHRLHTLAPSSSHLHTSVSAHLDRQRLHTLSPASSHLHTNVSSHLDRPRLHTWIPAPALPPFPEPGRSSLWTASCCWGGWLVLLLRGCDACREVGGGLQSGAALIGVRLDVGSLPHCSSSLTVTGCRLGGFPVRRDWWGGDALWEGCYPASALAHGVCVLVYV